MMGNYVRMRSMQPKQFGKHKNITILGVQFRRLLGRTLVATLLLSEASLKGEGKMTVKVNGDGPLGAIVVDGNANGL